MLSLNTLAYALRRKLLLVIVLTVLAFLSTQFVVMATVSTLGVDIGKIRAEQEQLRLENEELRSQISYARTIEQIVPSLDERFQTVQIRSNLIAN